MKPDASPVETGGHDPEAALRYRCTRCGACCRWDGYVRVSDEEIARIAALLDLTPEAVRRDYTRLTHDRAGLSLTEKPDGSCVFLADGNVCRIQDAKPRQCKLFPNFWNFSGFRRWCRCLDTWEQAGPEANETNPPAPPDEGASS
ncbi:MAG: Flagellin N-methylase [Lentisphaerae bacterium ADurb.BinA184]|nr:MAG: Flagellin N-methylase [Lentisphaerae bacterium ADurb.BinA184]